MSESAAVLVISHDVVGRRMAGPGIRYLNLARVLARQFPTILAVPGAPDCPADGFELWPYQFGQWEMLAPAVERARAILLCGDVLAWFPTLETCGVPLIVDGYDPHTVETLAMLAGHPDQAQRHVERERVLQMQCRAGDFFICASERQRDWWLGLLEAHGRVNARTYNDDPSLRKLIDVAPFGLPAEPPRRTRQVLKGVWPGVSAGDKVALWGGGLWQWLDPLTAIRAMARIRERRGDVKLVFPGVRHPNPVVIDMPMRHAAVELAADLGLLDHCVFFGDWASREEWPNYLLEADVGLSLHFDTLETRLAFRSRILDYIWAGLPIAATRGDATSELVKAYGLGLEVDYQDADGVAEAILALLDEPRGAREERFAAARAELTWERAARPVVEFCGAPRYAADRRVIVRFLARRNSVSESKSVADAPDLRQQVEALEWYHTIDLGNGIVTAGHYDHRPYLPYYGLPEDLTGKTVLDVGAASGFFSFEMERRGARVSAVDLPGWFDHDFGPCYQPDKTAEEGAQYLHEPIMLAKSILGSQIDRITMSIYDLSPDTVGMYDLVFCGSLLLHLTDPVRALWRLQSVTREVAIIVTVIHPDNSSDPLALFAGHHRGDVWWHPNRACLEAMVKSAGFVGWEWFSEFRLDYRDGRPGPYHGVIRAWNTPERPAMLSTVKPIPAEKVQKDPTAELRALLAERDAEIARLRELTAGYERGRFIRLMKWLRGKV